MRVLQIGATYVGAQKKIEKGIHNFLVRSGHESFILYAIGKTNEKNIICYEGKIANLTRRILRKFLGKIPKYAILSTKKIIKYIKRISPDIVNLHIVHHGYIDYVMLLKFLAEEKIPVIFTAHDMWNFTGGCYYYTNINCDGFKNGCVNCPKTTKEIDCNKNKTDKYFKLKMNLYKNLSKVGFISVSPWVYSEITKSELKKYPQYVIMNAVDDSEFVDLRISENEKFTIIGVAANWDERKGIKRFFELATALGDECNIILVGNIAEELKNTAPQNIIFKGMIAESRDLYRLYASSDLHVSMSLEETFGLTFIEAAFSGIKSLGFNSTAIPMVIEKTYGYIVDSNTVEDAAKKIKELIIQREKCRLSKEERMKIIDVFSVDRMASEYLKVFNDILRMEEKTE